MPDREEAEEAKEEEAPVVTALPNPKKRKALTEDVLCDKLGLERIYNEFPAACKYRGRGCEQQYLKNLIGRYKEWAFQLYDGLAYTDLLGTVETLGSKGRVRGYLAQLRDRERVRYMEQVLHVTMPSYTEEASPTSAQPQQNVSGYTTSSSTSGPGSQSLVHGASQVLGGGSADAEEIDDAAMYHLLDNYSSAADNSMSFSSTKTPSSAISVAGPDTGAGTRTDSGTGAGANSDDASIDRLVTVPVPVPMPMTLTGTDDTQVETQMEMETQMETQLETQTQIVATTHVASQSQSVDVNDDEAELDL